MENYDLGPFGFDFKGFRTGGLEDSDSGLGLVNKVLPFFMTWYIYKLIDYKIIIQGLQQVLGSLS